MDGKSRDDMKKSTNIALITRLPTQVNLIELYLVTNNTKNKCKKIRLNFTGRQVH